MQVQHELLQSIADEARRLNRLLENILQMSKLEAGQSKLNKELHVLEELVGTAVERTKSALVHHHVVLHIPHDLPLVHVDGLMIEQLLVNLLENAAHHTPRGTTVEVLATCEQSQLILHVADSGPGIVPDMREKIFEKFVRATATPDSVRGSGLGLAIARAIARSHDGSLALQVSRWGGADFVLRIPL